MAKPGPMQQALLAVLGATQGEASTMELYQALLGTYKPLSPAAIFIALDRMSKKGLIASRKGDPLPERGGKARLFYKITKDGRAALREVERSNVLLRSLFKFRPALAGQGGGRGKR